jgi:protein MpaA
MTWSRRQFLTAAGWVGASWAGAAATSTLGAAASWAAASAATVRRPRPHRRVLGHSSQGRPINAYRLGPRDAASCFVVIGQMHGDELAGYQMAHEFLLTAAAPDGVAFWVVPSMNPDGRAAGTRTNARGVDLNRNFPAPDWARRDAGLPTYSGPRPASEPETRAVRQFLGHVRPFTVVSFHQPFDVVDYSGGDPWVTRWLAAHLGLPTAHLVVSGGTMTGWFNATWPHRTAVTVELPRTASWAMRRDVADTLLQFAAVRAR